jgi:hypothetical protein
LGEDYRNQKSRQDAGATKGSGGISAAKGTGFLGLYVGAIHFVQDKLKPRPTKIFAGQKSRQDAGATKGNGGTSAAEADRILGALCRGPSLRSG